MEPGARAADQLIGAFRVFVGLVGMLHFAVFGEPAAAVIAIASVLAFGASRVSMAPRLAGRIDLHDLIPLALDLLSVVLVLGVFKPLGDGVVWSLLLLPVTEAAVRFQLVGAITTWLTGQVAISTLVGWQLEGPSLASQIVVAAVTVAVGLVAWQLDQRLLQVARARRESERRAELLTAVVGAARTVTALEPKRVLESVAEAALLLGFDMAEIAVADVGARELQPVVQRGWPEHHPPTPQRIDQGVAGMAYFQGSPVVVEDYQGWEHALPMHVRTGIARSAAAVPIITDGVTVAVLCVANREVRTVTDFERDCLDLLATQAGVAMRNARIHDERRVQQEVLKHQATHDALTGLANRAALIAEVEARLQAPIEVRTPTTVLFVDLDEFKGINDTYGHATGDAVLIEVSRRLTAAARPTDFVARYGGDEFVVLLDHRPDDVDGIAVRILEQVVQPFSARGNVLLPGASIGVAIERDGDDLDALIRRADIAMYAAKADGRGRVATS